MKVGLVTGLGGGLVEEEVAPLVQKPQQEEVELQEQCSMGLPAHQLLEVRALLEPVHKGLLQEVAVLGPPGQEEAAVPKSDYPHRQEQVALLRAVL